MRQKDEQQASVSVTWHATPAPPAQLTAWRWLWARLLGQTKPDPKISEPQDHVGTGAAPFAVVASDSHIVSEQANDSTHSTLST